MDIEAIAKQMIEREQREKRNKQRQDVAMKTYHTNLKAREIWQQMKQESNIVINLEVLDDGPGGQ